MTSDNRLKMVIFPTTAVNGSTISPQYTPQVINGEIVKIQFKGMATPGSFWLQESGGAVLFTKNNVTSGTAPFDIYPYVYADVNTGNGGPTAGSWVEPLASNSLLLLAASGCTSGTGTTFGPITLYFR